MPNPVSLASHRSHNPPTWRGIYRRSLPCPPVVEHLPCYPQQTQFLNVLWFRIPPICQGGCNNQKWTRSVAGGTVSPSSYTPEPPNPCQSLPTAFVDW